jgi:metalloendopeptidase OMA1, mitochondrial
MKRLKSGLVGITAVFFLFACSETPITGKKVFIVTSESQEMQLGVQAYDEILRKSRLSGDRRLTELVQRVGNRIAKVANKPDYRWEFRLIDSKEKNAFCLPGGKVAVYTGIFDVFDNEAELAAVLGHEVAHATARHAGQRITLGFGEELGFAALTQLIGGADTVGKKILLQALGVGATIGTVLPFSRSHESEADYIGQVYMAMAGYEPGAAVTLWEEFAKQSGGAPPEFLSTHPAPEHRIEELRGHLADAENYYRNAPERYGLGEPL